MWAFLADIVILLHAAWALFLAFGFLFALKDSRLVFPHLGGLLFSVFLNLMGWYCPLTYLENTLHSLDRLEAVYSSSYMMEYVYRFLYPDLPEPMIRIGEIIFVCLNLFGYVFIGKKHHIFHRLEGSGWKRHA